MSSSWGITIFVHNVLVVGYVETHQYEGLALVRDGLKQGILI